MHAVFVAEGGEFHPHQRVKGEQALTNFSTAMFMRSQETPA